MKVTLTVLSAPWAEPLRSAHDAATTAGRELVLCELQDATGRCGWGEAAPLPSYDGVSLAAVLAALEDLVPILAADPGDDLGALGAACRAHCRVPQALAAVDLALWDLHGRRRGAPLWQLLGAAAPAPVPVNALIGAEAPARAATQARMAVTAGFGTVKVKVGVGDDIARVAAVRAAVGDGIRVRVDANGAWAEPGAALATLAALDRFALELCEEPVHGAAGIAAVQRGTQLPIAVDESSPEPAVLEHRCADLLCVKISAAGGLSGALEQARRARELGYEVFLASTLDGPLGIAAALHAGAVLGPGRACGLATLSRFAAPSPLPVHGGVMAPPPGPGLGEGLLPWYAAQRGVSR
ncbi:MAG TPA: enolase C-terminal domain-like protein [Solirubrobacteraceae bacterium]|nr:enolase C-terminal domain-like protein [Solirubrobacteraceae bacterium]